MARESATFSVPLLAALDARGRADLRAAAKRRVLEAGARVFGVGDPADTLCLVESGSVGVEVTGERPTARAGELFGREALVGGLARSGRAQALEPSILLEFPAGALRRALARAGADELFAREEARARARAWAVLIAGTPLGAQLSAAQITALVASGREEQRARGEALFPAGEAPDCVWVVLRGLLELGAGELRSESYAAAGDLVGLREALRSESVAFEAKALGDVALLRVPARTFRELASSAPEAVALAERALEARYEKQRRVKELASQRATRHAFHELERLESARSLLAIDLETCVRCGHCAWACADAHGTPRLARRGDKVKLAVRAADGTFAERALLIADACQHCKDPACLSECPTGAITRSADGAVLVREDLCTGCGACAKACPWDAVRMAPRSPGSGDAAQGSLVAVKCDLCHELSGPECVNACPTGAILRAEPARDLVEVRSVLGTERVEPNAGARRRFVPPLAALAFVPPLVALARLGHELSGFRFATGVLSGLACCLLALHSLVKRIRRVRDWSRRVAPLGAGGLRRAVGFHSLTGALALLLVGSHAGLSVPRGTAGALCIAFWVVALSGGFGALVYRALPPRLARLERRGSLPEDRLAEREELRQSLFDGVSAQNAAVKELARRVLVPYAGAFGGALALVLSGRALAEEEAALERRIETLLGGRRSERLGELGKLVRIAVGLRALRARRLLELLLGAWLPVHAAGVVLLLALLTLHVLGVSGVLR